MNKNEGKAVSSQSKDCPKCGEPMRWKFLAKDRCERCEGPAEVSNMVPESKEDALDCALSGQSYTQRLIDSVCSELNAMAIDLRVAHTVNGQWPASESDTFEKYDHLRRMANELRKLKVVHRGARDAMSISILQEITRKVVDAVETEKESRVFIDDCTPVVIGLYKRPQDTPLPGYFPIAEFTVGQFKSLAEKPEA